MSGGRVTIDDGIAKTVEAAGLKSPDLCFTERRELKLAELHQNGALKRYQIDAELNLKREQPG